MILNPLIAISPVDGRYRKQTHELASFFSEASLIRYRVLVEIEYFIELSKLNLKGFNPLSDSQIISLRDIYERFDEIKCIKNKGDGETTTMMLK
jgi:adenylosuccinate lyase